MEAGIAIGGSATTTRATRASAIAAAGLAGTKNTSVSTGNQLWAHNCIVRSAATTAGDHECEPVFVGDKTPTTAGAAALVANRITTDLHSVKTANSHEHLQHFAANHIDIALNARTLAAENGAANATATLGTKDFNGE